MSRIITPLIIDVEASGFDMRGYPIEVGVALWDNNKYCSLIKPAADWTHWDEEAEAMHRITRENLETHGNPLKVVAAQLNKIAGGKTLYSDGWVVDKPWLIKLFHAARINMNFHISPLEMILTEHQMKSWHGIKEQVIKESNIIRHRASSDAWVVQETYKRSYGENVA